MPIELTPAGIICFISALVAAWMGKIAWQRRRIPGGGYLAIGSFGASLWGFADGLGSILPSFAGKLFAAKLSYLGITTVIPFWFLFIFAYLRRSRYPLGKVGMGLVFVLPTVVLVAALTNEYHRLIWQTIDLAGERSGAELDYEYGVLYVVWRAYSYGALAIGVLALLYSATQVPSRVRAQNLIMAAATTTPGVANLFYQLGGEPHPGFDITPIGFAMTGVLSVVALVRYRLLDVVPLARNLLFDHLADGVIVLDPSGRVVDANGAALRLLGADLSQWQAGSRRGELGLRPAAVFSRWRQLEFPRHLEQSNRSEICFEEAGELVCIDVRATELTEKDRPTPGHLIMVYDVSEQKRLEAALRHSAYTDSLTGLCNRRSLMESLEIARANSSEHPFALLYLDLDGFKAVNDRYGHDAGDELLREVSRRIVEVVDGYAESLAPVVARLGGDEFAVLLSGEGAIENAVCLAERISTAIEEPIALDDLTVKVGASIGVGRSDEAGDAMISADRSMYRAKAKRKSRGTGGPEDSAGVAYLA